MSYYGFLVRHPPPHNQGSRIPRRQSMGRFAQEVMLFMDRLSNTYALRRGLEAFNFVLAFSAEDFPTPTPSLSPRRRISATTFLWVGSGARSSDLPEHAVRVFPSLQVLNRVPPQFPHQTFEHPRQRHPPYDRFSVAAASATYPIERWP
ncbi:hypothetical protein CGLO_09554 [Colletotrichum gloeosporioides Cg-14]|uniref:Uncharacterized protein n=1 Tax=Colletotrichum gloeosporioides (strain Cg-14) TaxID=1237896 RepID=T0LHB9_COLGC|nr:hypothetical protein CGLO_09554 [Colletotrichum gloeosporioides Cg-14]